MQSIHVSHIMDLPLSFADHNVYLLLTTSYISTQILIFLLKLREFGLLFSHICTTSALPLICEGQVDYATSLKGVHSQLSHNREEVFIARHSKSLRCISISESSLTLSSPVQTFSCGKPVYTRLPLAGSLISPTKRDCYV